MLFVVKRKFRENASIINIFTQKKGKLMELFTVVLQEKLETIYKYLINFCIPYI